MTPRFLDWMPGDKQVPFAELEDSEGKKDVWVRMMSSVGSFHCLDLQVELQTVGLEL